MNGLYSYSSTLGDSVHETIMNKAGDAINVSKYLINSVIMSVRIVVPLPKQ